jgi:hypothetical protein
MVQGLNSYSKERRGQEEDFGRGPFDEVLHSSWQYKGVP